MTSRLPGSHLVAKAGAAGKAPATTGSWHSYPKNIPNGEPRPKRELRSVVVVVHFVHAFHFYFLYCVQYRK